eukprot:TRINITY_DN69057_c0_g1_i1.p1 TRINITY_DN69057_c0_g1~~TRINITY_DN69057_c0_g1_i1.p1  ORF type:complete len:345 (+),score=50.97 TRINITY_DN69057_c0_g1_i1:64-1035(+)
MAPPPDWLATALQQLVVCGLKCSDMPLSGPVSSFVNTHVAFHGTSHDNVASITTDGFKESLRGMFGRGVYAAHDFAKAERFGESILKVVFSSKNIVVSSAKDPLGLWRLCGLDGEYSTVAKRSELCFDPSRVMDLTVSHLKGGVGIADKTRARISEYFLTNPAARERTVYIAIRADDGICMGIARKMFPHVKPPPQATLATFMRILKSACTGAMIGAGIVRFGFDFMFDSLARDSKKISPKQLDDMMAESIAVGVAAGTAVGTVVTFVSASQVVAAPGVWGLLGYTTTVGFTSGVVATGAAVAFPLALVSAGAWMMKRVKDKS